VAVTYSVVIPTRDRRPLLLEVLRALDRQLDAPDFEVVVVDDASRDDTLAELAESRFGFPLKAVRGYGHGPAAARNLGIRACRGQLVALLGDDTIPDPEWLSQHQRARQNRAEPVAVLGHLDWHPRLPRGRFLRWLNEQGKQFGYALIKQSEQVPFNFFYASNLSLPRRLLIDQPFAEEFPGPAWEDIELGYRLVQLGGLKLVYSQSARAWHDHPTNLDQFARRQRMVGRSARIFAHLHPELADWLGVGSKPPRAMWGWLLPRLCRLFGHPWLWEALARHNYRLGLQT